jgi:mannose/cellobiose epimerase-like protein (N-acyl-D-glucosamine 2-epimerase family)
MTIGIYKYKSYYKLERYDMNSKYIIDTAENKEFLKENALSLLKFGRKFPSPNGSSYYLGDDGTPWTDRPRETWITSRMAHVYSIGSMMKIDGCKELAEAAIKGLSDELQDKKNGGWYAGVTADGGILPNKQCYAHAFVILAATSGRLAGVKGADKLLEKALAVYDKYFWDEEEGLSVDTWNTEFTELDTYRGINANMHTVEAFLAAADTLDDEKYRVRAGRIIDRVAGWAKENGYRIPEHFTSDWKPDLEKNKEKPDDPFKPYGATPGHGIEWARLITQWALSSKLNADAEKQYIDTACRLYRRAIDDAWNADGAPGIVYTTDWEGKPVVHDRMHWTLAEAINSSAVLYRVTGEARYAGDYAEFMKYLDETVLDHTCGSWFHQLDEKNNLKGTVWPGKSDLYHAFQAMNIPYLGCDVSIARAIYCN